MAEMVMQQIDPILMNMIVNSVTRDRKIYMNEGFTTDSIFKVAYYLDRLISLDKKMGTKEPIEIVISSYGGDAYSCIFICEKIIGLVKSGYEIITTVQDTAFSAAFFMLICGSKRRAYKGSRIMCHAANTGAVGRHQDIIDDLDETNAIWDKIKEITISQTKITNEKLEELKKYKIDWYFWADEALELGVIDEIL